MTNGTEVRFTHSDSFPEVLAELGGSLLVSTYQAGQLVSIGLHEGRVSLSFQAFDQAMGVAVGDGRVAVGSRRQVWMLRDHADVAAAIAPPGRFDRCLIARSSTVTGIIQGHELAWVDNGAQEPELWVVNTLFSCLAAVHPDFSFVPRWRPPFITALAAEDRCHLNGLAMRDGKPAYVSLMARTDVSQGWRQLPKSSGVVLDIVSGEPVANGIVMPHSPRWHDGRLVVLNSGMGAIDQVDLDSGVRTQVVPLPGFTRGLAIQGRFAFVGLSKVRETAVFGGTPIAEFHDQLKCGVGVVDMQTGATVASFEFQTGVEEIFDVQIVPGARSLALGDGSGEDVWVVPRSTA